MVNKQINNICINEEFLSGIVPELSFVFLSSIFKIYLEIWILIEKFWNQGQKDNRDNSELSVEFLW